MILLRLFFIWSAFFAPAHADDEYRERAKSEMHLDFDMDDVAAEMAQPAQVTRMSDPRLPPQPALPLEPNSALDTVVVYRDRALVTRVLAVDLPAGASAVTFTGLPLGLSADGLIAQTREGGARITGVTLVGGTSPEAVIARKEALKDQIRPLLDELGRIRDRLESLLAQRDYLHANLLMPASGDRPSPSVDQVRGMLTFLGEAERDIGTRIRAEQDLAEKVEEKLHPLLVQLSDPLATGQSVRVDVDAAKGGRSTVALRYQVAGATWSPSYNARLDEATGRVTLEYFGIIAQHTGEAWTEATLSLSTADPDVAGDLPVIEAWYLGRDDMSVGAALQSGRGMSDALNNRSQSFTTPSGEEVMGDTTARKGGGTVVFDIAGRRTVPGDGSEQRIPIGQQSFGSTLELSAVPRQVPAVFRRGSLRYEGQAPLLPGPISTFVGGDFVGSGALGTILPGEELKLSFGTDDRFRVQRQLVSRTIDHLGAGKKMVRYTFDYRITVTSFADTAQQVLIADQVPVAELDRVTVEVTETSGALPPLPDDPPGILRWRPTLAPNDKTVIKLTFSVTFPREEEARYGLDAMY
jgi:uncharacterized protein (TIGR02231 family)